MLPLHISLLGTIRITRGEAAITGIESERGRALLAYLAVESGRLHRRETLAALLWPEANQTGASQNLRRAIYNLRQALESDSEGSVLLVSRQDVQFNRAAGHQVDALTVAALFDATATHAHKRATGIEACEWCVERLREAAALYTGDFLASLSFMGGEQFEVWRTHKQENLHIRMMMALSHIAHYHKLRREYAATIGYLRQQLSLEPWREEAHAQLIETLALNGQTAEALQQYEVCKQILADELHTEPAPATIALMRRIQAGEPVLLPLRPRTSSPHNLPAQITALVGRETELAEITTLLGREDVRLVTLKGTGGTGKTRLALELGLQAETRLPDSFEDGVWLVELAAIDDPKLVVPTIAATLGVKEVRGVSLGDTLNLYLKSKRMLLILDNLEQVIESALDISKLLTSGPGVKVLCTSRRPLRIRGEREYRVRPLALPDMKQLPSPEALTRNAAIQLFVERASDVNDAFELTNENAATVAEICVRLDGLPLALELAATRVRLFSPQTLLAKLSTRLELLMGGAVDMPVRHQTMRGAIAWSYDLLDDEQKQLFRRISVFHGSPNLEDVEAVCAYDSEKQNVPDGVQSLLDKSLLQRRQSSEGELRLSMLETLHEYAHEKLQASGESAALKSEHASYYMRLAEEAEPQLTGQQQTEWLTRLEHEHDNIRAAIRWALEVGSGEAIAVGLRLVGALWRFWNVRGHFTEGRAHLTEVLEKEAIQATPAMRAYRAKALNGAGVLAWSQGDYAAAHDLHAASLILRRELGDRQGVAHVLTNMGILAWSQGDCAAARALHEESLAIKRELGDKLGISYSLNNLGTVTKEQGDYAAAHILYEESLALRRELGDKLGVAYTLTNLGTVAHVQGNYAYALALHEESLAIKRELGDEHSTAYTLNNLGNVAKEQGNFTLAGTLYKESLAMQQDLGDRLGAAFSLNNLGTLAYVQKDYVGARALYEESLTLRRELGDKIGIAASLNNLGHVARAQEMLVAAHTLYIESLFLRRELGNSLNSAASLAGLGYVAMKVGEVEQGTRMLAAVARLLEELGAVLDREDRVSYEQAARFAREHLDEAKFQRAWQAGMEIGIGQVVDRALEGSEPAEKAHLST